MSTIGLVDGAYHAGQSNTFPGIPAGVVEDSRVVVIAANVSGSSLTTPTGFTSELYETSTVTLLVATKTATGPESGTYTVPGTFLNNLASIAFRPTGEHPGGWLVDLVGGTLIGGTTATESLSMADPGVGALLVWAVASSPSRSVTVPSGYTRVTPDTATQRIHLAYRVHPGGAISGISGTFSATAGSRSVLMAIAATGLRDHAGNLMAATEWDGATEQPLAVFEYDGTSEQRIA
ncbi:hypothetical protein HMPREF0063_10037 [Aeromicrobium marinum DSM 15272]|uniref:Uncharacterized protein n=1 Tax=Aeromicrobium marinum DSM 15272 TaxID=585531 RepID=E2S7N0_9ACTN|nr:hypothetical protein [Aeromicrobium marinum]EFQ84696.1 hypothetical protein HMPREF0063_10037 [Aeromicrobium marinum DSM 15272]